MSSSSIAKALRETGQAMERLGEFKIFVTTRKGSGCDFATVTFTRHCVTAKTFFRAQIWALASVCAILSHCPNLNNFPFLLSSLFRPPSYRKTCL